MSEPEDALGEYEEDLLVSIIQDEMDSYIRIACATALAGLGSYGDEPAQAQIVNQMQHLHLAEPWLPAALAARRLRQAGLAQ